MIDTYKARIIELQTAWMRMKNVKQARKEAHKKVFEDLLMEPVLHREFTDEEKNNIRSLMNGPAPFNEPEFIASAHDCSVEDAYKIMAELGEVR